MNSKISKAFKIGAKITVAGLFTFLFLFNINIITGDDGWSIQLVKSVFGQPVPCVEGSPDWPDCNSGGGPGGGPKKGWVFNPPITVQCYKIITMKYVGGITVDCATPDGVESRIVKNCILGAPEVPDPNCIVGQMIESPTCVGDKRLRGPLNPSQIIPCGY